jgi:CDP-diacylglycerol--glycerol-3-phosphate 3-phosphatidyltransferase
MEHRGKFTFVLFLTLVRFPLVLLFAAGAVAHVFRPNPWLFYSALSVLVLSTVTDLFDGYFARRFHVESRFGANVDPLMDKFFYVCTLPVLVFVTASHGNAVHSAVLVALTVSLLLRDLWVTFLRSFGAMYDDEGGANWAGKLRTGLMFPMICALFLLEEHPMKLFSPAVVYSFEGLAMAINAVSVYVYTRRYWQYLVKSTGL